MLGPVCAVVMILTNVHGVYSTPLGCYDAMQACRTAIKTMEHVDRDNAVEPGVQYASAFCIPAK